MEHGLRRAEAMLVRPLRVGIMGEANCGKSSLANLLMGDAVIPILQYANTRIPTLIRYARKPSIAAILGNGTIHPLVVPNDPPPGMICACLGLPIAHLKGVEIMDFPGLANPWLSYRSADIARHRIDASIWCTFSTQAWKESERAAWSRLPRRLRAHALLVVTNADLLRTEQAEKVAAHLAKATANAFHARAFVSTPQAQQALGAAGRVRDPALWMRSGASDLFAGLGALLLDIRRERQRRVKAFAAKIAEKALSDLKHLHPAP